MKFEYSRKYIELREKTDYAMILETAKNDLINKNNVNEAYYWILHAPYIWTIPQRILKKDINIII